MRVLTIGFLVGQANGKRVAYNDFIEFPETGRDPGEQLKSE